MPGPIGSAGRPLASLSSTLLARKGHATPAMRRQGNSAAPGPAPLDDLGWNDMGGEPAAAAAAPTPITAAVEPAPVAAPPPVLAERAALREEIEAAPPPPDVVPAAEPAPAEALAAVRPVSLATAGRFQRETTRAGRAAFTLRLDAERHLKLRLASAVAHRSAQQLVVHALDRLLLTLPEVDALRAQLPAAIPPKQLSPKRKRP